jgi:hypothetical protein
MTQELIPPTPMLTLPVTRPSMGTGSLRTSRLTWGWTSGCSSSAETWTGWSMPRATPRCCAVSSQPPQTDMPCPKVPLRAVIALASGNTDSAVSSSVQSPGVAVACMSQAATSAGATPASRRAARIAVRGPSSDGVMMWSASELVPTPRISRPTGFIPISIR